MLRLKVFPKTRFQRTFQKKKERKLTSASRSLYTLAVQAEVSIPLHVIPVGALYAQSFPIFRQLTTNYRNIKIVFHFNILAYMFTENQV